MTYIAHMVSVLSARPKSQQVRNPIKSAEQFTDEKCLAVLGAIRNGIKTARLLRLHLNLHSKMIDALLQRLTKAGRVTKRKVEGVLVYEVCQ